MAALQAGQLLVVDDDLSPDADFAQIADALQVAGEDDAILVLEGTYAPFEIFDRSARIFGIGSERPIIEGSVKIAGQSLDQRVVLDGLTIRYTGVGLAIDQAQGPIWLEDLSIEVAPQIALPLPAVVIDDSANVMLSNVRAVPILDDTPLGTWGALIGDSVVHAYDSHFRASTSPLGTPIELPGLKLTGSFLFASGCTFVGADGLQASDSAAAGCAGAEDGSAAVVVDSSPLLASQFIYFGNSFVPGAGGSAADECPAGSDGTAIHVDGASSLEPLEIELGPRSYNVTPVVFPGEPLLATFHGSPGEFVASYLGIEPNPVFFPDVSGSFGALGSNLVFDAGLLDESGTLTIEVLSALPPDIDFVAAYGQGLFVSDVDGIVLGTPRAVLLASTVSLNRAPDQPSPAPTPGPWNDPAATQAAGAGPEQEGSAAALD